MRMKGIQKIIKDKIIISHKGQETRIVVPIRKEIRKRVSKENLINRTNPLQTNKINNNYYYYYRSSKFLLLFQYLKDQ